MYPPPKIESIISFDSQEKLFNVEFWHFEKVKNKYWKVSDWYSPSISKVESFKQYKFSKSKVLKYSGIISKLYSLHFIVSNDVIVSEFYPLW